MEQEYLILPTRKFDFDYTQEYNKIKTTSYLIKILNQTIEDGFRLNTTTAGHIWNPYEDNYKFNLSKWISILSSVIIYSNFNHKEHLPRNNVVADILNVKVDWIKGFIFATEGKYKNDTSQICKRKTERAIQCKDGIEIGNLIYLTYLTEYLYYSNYYRYDSKLFNSHKWIISSENQFMQSLGAQCKIVTFKCEKCNMYGGTFFDKYYKKDKYFIHNKINGMPAYKFSDYNYNCNETLIKNIIE